MIKDRRKERRCVVAEVTVLGGGHMVHRRILTDGIDPIVTSSAVVGDASVIKHTGGKSTGIVAHPTILGSGDMCGGFTRGDRAVVAGCTIAGDTFVREDRGPKRRGGMTKVAILRSGYMISGRFLTRGINTIVTPVTAIGYTGVIKHAGSKTASNMAHGTIFRGRNMIH